MFNVGGDVFFVSEVFQLLRPQVGRLVRWMVPGLVLYGLSLEFLLVVAQIE